MIKKECNEENTPCKYLASWYGDYWAGEYLKREWFESMRDGEFEGVKVKIPCGYHEYLSGIYHDYMQLPPVEKRVSHHYHYYLNLDRHLTIEQIKKLNKQ